MNEICSRCSNMIRSMVEQSVVEGLSRDKAELLAEEKIKIIYFHGKCKERFDCLPFIQVNAKRRNLKLD